MKCKPSFSGHLAAMVWLEIGLNSCTIFENSSERNLAAIVLVCFRQGLWYNVWAKSFREILSAKRKRWRHEQALCDLWAMQTKEETCRYLWEQKWSILIFGVVRSHSGLVSVSISVTDEAPAETGEDWRWNKHLRLNIWHLSVFKILIIWIHKSWQKPELMGKL